MSLRENIILNLLFINNLEIFCCLLSRYSLYDSWKSKIKLEFKCSICNLNLKWGLRGMASVNTYTFVVFWMNYIYTKWWWSPEMNYGLGSVQVRLKPVGYRVQAQCTLHIHESVMAKSGHVRQFRVHRFLHFNNNERILWGGNVSMGFTKSQMPKI